MVNTAAAEQIIAKNGKLSKDQQPGPAPVLIELLEPKESLRALKNTNWINDRVVSGF